MNYGVRIYFTESKKEAKDICNMMDYLVKMFGVTRVADFYQAVKIPCSFTDWKLGWTEPGCLRYEKVYGKDVYEVMAADKPTDISNV